MNGKSSEFLTPALKCTSSFTPPQAEGVRKKTNQMWDIKPEPNYCSKNTD